MQKVLSSLLVLSLAASSPGWWRRSSGAASRGDDDVLTSLKAELDAKHLQIRELQISVAVLALGCFGIDRLHPKLLKALGAAAVLAWCFADDLSPLVLEALRSA